MPAPDYFTLEGDVTNAVAPFIAALDDGTGGAGDSPITAFLVNDQENMPEPGQHPDARDLNQVAYLAWAAGIMMPKLSVAIHVSGITPSVNSFIAPNRKILIGDITPTRVAAGHYRVVVPQAKLPQKTMPPKVYANNSAAVMISAVWTSSATYDVYIANASGAVDCDFSIDFWGY